MDQASLQVLWQQNRDHRSRPTTVRRAGLIVLAAKRLKARRQRKKYGRPGGASLQDAQENINKYRALTHNRNRHEWNADDDA